MSTLATVELTEAQDRDLRAYAVALSPDDGEDAYHNAIETVLRRPVQSIRNPAAFFRTVIKRALLKIWRHDGADMRQSASYLAGDPPSMAVGLAVRRTPQSHCRRGHLFTPDNEYTVGARRTCRICLEARQEADRTRRVERLMNILKGSPHA